MTLTIIAPDTNGRFGPGILAIVHIPSGPVPNDDRIGINISVLATGTNMLDGASLAHGSLNVLVIPGVFENGPNVPRYPSAGLVDGTPIIVTVTQAHANGTLVDTGSRSDLHWDAVSGLWTFFASGGSLGAILAAVRKSY